MQMCSRFFIFSSFTSHPCTLIKTPPYFKALHHQLTPIGFPPQCHWVYGAALRLLMAQSILLHMNMEISHTLQMVFCVTGLIQISNVFVDWWHHPPLFLIMHRLASHYLCIQNERLPKNQLWIITLLLTNCHSTRAQIRSRTSLVVVASCISSGHLDARSCCCMCLRISQTRYNVGWIITLKGFYLLTGTWWLGLSQILLLN